MTHPQRPSHSLHTLRILLGRIGKGFLESRGPGNKGLPITTRQTDKRRCTRSTRGCCRAPIGDQTRRRAALSIPFALRERTRIRHFHFLGVQPSQHRHCSCRIRTSPSTRQTNRGRRGCMHEGALAALCDRMNTGRGAVRAALDALHALLGLYFDVLV